MAAILANGAIESILSLMVLDKEFVGKKPDKLLAVRDLSGARRLG